MNHHIVAKLIFVSQRCRLDIQTVVSYLCTRVLEPDEGDWGKLKRLLEYLKTTRDTEYLILVADNLSIMRSYIDGAHGAHDDMRGHAGGGVTLGRGCVMSKSRKLKLNTKSSTETEVVAHSDLITEPIWGNKFMKSQGYELALTSYQDNMSAMKLEKNGRRSCGKKSKHIDIRYFFVKDYIDRGEIKLEYCPTEMMLADFFTKPLQGALFRKMRAVILGHITVDEFNHLCLSSEERVGNKILRDRKDKANLGTGSINLDTDVDASDENNNGRSETSERRRI